MITKILNRRHACWAELLAGYDFVLTPIPKSKNPTDGPSLRPDYAEDVVAPSDPLLPSSSLRNLPSDTLETLQCHLEATSGAPPPDAPLFRLSTSLAVFAPEPSLHQRFLDALSNDSVAIAQKEPTDPYVAQWFSITQFSYIHT